jgi:hypothetical protein
MYSNTIRGVQQSAFRPAPHFPLKPIRKRPENTELLRHLPRWQSNNSPEDLGIIRFGFEMFPDILKRELGVADWVRQALYEVLRYTPGDKKIDRCHAICTYREGSKTTWFAVILPLYFMLVGQYGIYHKEHLLPEVDYVRVRGKNLDEAEKKMQNVATHFTDEKVEKLFGRLQPTLKEIKDKSLKKTSSFIILLNGYIYQALGITQPSRGALIKGRRPKMDIDDDVQNNESCRSEIDRKKVANEVIAEQFGGLHDEGLTIFIGNYVHEECMLRHLLKNPGWKPQFYAIVKVDKDGDPILDANGNMIPDWKAKNSLEYIKGLEKWYSEHEELGGRRYYMREYMNKIVADKDYKLLYYSGEYRRAYGANWLVKKNTREGEYHEEWIRAFVVVSIDPSISTKTGSSDGVITVTMFCSDKKRRVHDVSLGKFDIRDRYFDESKRPPILANTPEQLQNVKRRGGVEEVVRKILQYHADAWVSENAGQQLAWYNDIKELLERLNLGNIPGLPYHPTDEKVYKLETGLLNLFAAGYYEINFNMVYKKAVENQVESFPENKMDILDALHNAEKIGRIPPQAIITGSDGYRSPAEEKSDAQKLLENKDVEAWAVIG